MADDAGFILVKGGHGLGNRILCLLSANPARAAHRPAPRDRLARSAPFRGRARCVPPPSAFRSLCWSDGTASREFLYVEECSRAIVLATERYDGAEPVNVGAGEECRIADLVGLIAELAGFRADVEWDASKPNGQPRRCLDVSRAAERFGFRAEVALRDGLRRTVDWVREARRRAV